MLIVYHLSMTYKSTRILLPSFENNANDGTHTSITATNQPLQVPTSFFSIYQING